MQRTLSLIILFFSSFALWAQDPVVSVTGGEIRGQALGQGGSFKGVPFAAPPVDANRWREPLPVVSWSGIRDAGEFGAACAQRDAGWNRSYVAVASEDCLFLNIWSPDLDPQSPKAVMVWFHGGGNTGGSTIGLGGIEPSFDGTDLAQHDVVVVSVNYRLGIFGFFAHPALTAESPHNASGNYGLLDQIAALSWVQDNIAAFGGDPDNVTIFGQSAGGHDVSLLMTSPLAEGLFAKTIVQSGTVFIGGSLTPPLSQLERGGREIAALVNAPETEPLEHLRSLSTEQVLAAYGAYQDGGVRLEPNVDGHVLTDLPAQIFLSGQQAAVPMLIGNNARERRLGEEVNLADVIAETYGPLAPQAMAIYGGNQSAYAPYGDIKALFRTDTSFRCSAVTQSRWHAALAPTYEYEFSPGYEPRGASHSWELQYVFGNLRPDAQAPGDYAVSETLQTYWANFAKAGDPNGGSLTRWPQLDAAGGYLEIAAGGPIQKAHLRQQACALFEEKLLGDMAAWSAGS